MTAVLPDKTTTTTTPRDTFVEATHTLTDGYLLYRPDENAFIALYPEEFFECRKVGEQNNLAIQELQQANQAVTEKSLALTELLRNPLPTKSKLEQAREELDKALATLSVKSEAAKTRIEQITDLKVDEKKLVEVLPLTLARDARQKAFYIPAEKLKSAAADKRVYLVEGKAERSKGDKEKLLVGNRLNGTEIKRRLTNQVVDQAKFEKKWKLKPKDGDEYAGQFFSTWSKTMGADAKDFLEREQERVVEGVFGPVNHDPNDPHRHIDLKSEAQLMRWAAGAGLEANFMPFQGNVFDKRDKDWKSRFRRGSKAVQFNIKANAEASFAVGEAKVQTVGYFPHFAGWHLTPAEAGIALDLGNFRLRGDLTLSAVAGASVALEAGAGLLLTASKQGLRGVPRNAKAVKAKASADGSVKLFAGLKEGVDLAGGLQWLNPEGFIDEKSPKRKDPTKSWGEYVDIAKITTGVAAIQGLSATLGFEVGYRDGNFVIAAKAGGCLGLGGEGNFSFKADAASIGQLFMCVAHQLKQADYRRLESLIRRDVYEAYNQILFMVQSGERKIHDFVNSRFADVDAVESIYQNVIETIKMKGRTFIIETERRMRDGWGWFAYMPPEARGAMIATVQQIVDQPRYAEDRELRQLAAFSVNELLATGQTTRQLENTLDRVTFAIGEQSSRTIAATAIASLLNDSSFAGGLERATLSVATARPLVHRPFVRNDEASFVVAEMSFSHLNSIA